MGLVYLYLQVGHWLNPRFDTPLYCEALSEGEYSFKLEKVEDNSYNLVYKDKSLQLSKVSVDIIEATLEQLKLEEIKAGVEQIKKIKPGIPSYKLEIKYESGKIINRSANPGTNEKIFQLTIHLRTILEQAGCHRVTIGRYNSFYGLTRDYFAPGEIVSFRVSQPSDASLYASAEGVRLEKGDFEGGYWHYSFIMPNRDVKVEITMRDNMMNPLLKGDAPLGFMGRGRTMGNMMQYNGKIPPNPQKPSNQSEQKFCTECGAANAKTAKFCTMCGRKF